MPDRDHADTERLEQTIKALRSTLRSIDRDLKSAQDGGVTMTDAHALRALAVRAKRAGQAASENLYHIIVREQERQQRRQLH